jgi:3-hydroxyisobutyrate dehydrogenase
MPAGFIGMGIMGSGMARNVLGKGHALMVWNRTPEKASAITGAAVAQSIEELVTNCDPILLCLSDTSDVEEVVLSPGGVRGALAPGKLVVDHSTISPTATRELAAAVEEVGASWLDAPVSGGSEGAQRGTLSIMVGGSPDDLARVESLLSAYGTSVIHVGPVGSGQTAKLVNQILVVGNQLAASEALLFAEAAGLDLTRTLAAVKDGAAGSWMLANRGPQMIAHDWRPGFTIDLQQKDLRLVLEAADSLQLPLPGTSLIHQLYLGLQRQGLGGEGNHALIKALSRMAGKVEERS